MPNRLRRYFISGLIVFLPLALTINLFVLTFNFADSILGRYLEPYLSREFGFYVKGISILLCVCIIFLMGFFATNFIGRRSIPILEKMLLTLPFFKQVYPAIKEIAVFLFSREKLAFKQVVLVEYPRPGLYSVAFLMSNVPKKISEKTNQELCYVFVPHTPSPLTGFLTLAPKKDLIHLDITIEEAIKIIISGGVVGTDQPMLLEEE